MRRAAVIGALALVAACGGDDAPTAKPASTAPPAGAITKVTENGPVKITVQVWPPEPELGDPIHLRLTAESQAGVSLDLPYQEMAIGRFDVSDYAKSEQRTGQTRIQVQDYVLDAPSSGRHRIPAFRLEMLDPRATAAAGSNASAAAVPVEILTEEVPLQIKEVSVGATTAALPPARGRLAADVGGRPMWHYAIVGLGVAWIAIAILLVVRLRKRRAVRIKMSAYDVAVGRLRGLEQRGAPAGDDADAWFVELSGIVRRYLEERYDIRAPELTTEEFLAVASRSPELTAEHRELLSSFMARCDRVKFAGYRPDADESLATLRAARGFIEDTRLRPTDLAAGAAAKGAAA
jgi:hypothetical protein